MNLVLTIIYVFAALAMGFSICWLMLRANHSMMTYMFIGCQSAIIIWLVSQIIGIQAISLRQFTLSYNIGNFGICFIGMFWLLFSAYYTGKEPKRNLIVLLVIFSALLYIAAFTNPYHHQYYAKLYFRRVDYAPLFYVNQAYIYFCMIFGIVLILRNCLKKPSFSKSQAVLIIFAAVLPLTLNLLTLSGVLKLKFSITPPSFAVSSVLILLATYRYGFLNVNAIAFEDALNSIEEGIIVFNKRGSITYLSKAAQKMLGITESTTYSEFIETADCREDFDNAEIDRNDRRLSLKRYYYRDTKGSPLAVTVIVSDVTRYYQLIEKTEELAAAEKSLLIEQERNRIAQEVHDTAGHTFTMISSLARLAKVETEKSNIRNEQLDSFISETEALSRSGIMQLRCSINNLRDDRFMTSAVQAVKTLSETVRDMEIELYVQGAEDESYSHCIKTVYDNCRELITNCLRYSSATRMDIIMKFLGSSLEIYVLDNGKGCGSGKIKEGNGLRGIRERTEKLGGTVKFVSSEDGGFSTTMKIPIAEQ